MGKGFLKHFHLGGKAKQNYLQKLKNGEKQNKYCSMPGKRNIKFQGWVGREREKSATRGISRGNDVSHLKNIFSI